MQKIQKDMRIEKENEQNAQSGKDGIPNKKTG